MYHLAALHGNIKLLKRGIDEDPEILSKQFQYSDVCLVEEFELSDEYAPPPVLPQLVRAAVNNCNLLDATVSCDYVMFGLLSRQLPLDQRWLISFGFKYAPLLHYACAGNQLDAVKLLLSRGSDMQAINAVHRKAEDYTTSREILELLRPFSNCGDPGNYSFSCQIIDSSHDNGDLRSSVITDEMRSSSSNSLSSGQRARATLSSKYPAHQEQVSHQLDQVLLSLRRTFDCAEDGSPTMSEKSSQSKLRNQTKIAATHPAESNLRPTIMKKLRVVSTSDQKSSDRTADDAKAPATSVAFRRASVCAPHAVTTFLQSRESPLQALFNEASATITSGATDRQMQTRWVAIVLPTHWINLLHM